MSLRQRIIEDMKSAMKARESARLSAIRLLMAAMKQKEVDERTELNDTDVATVIAKMLKQRRESVKQYEAAQRTDLVAKEQAEIDVLLAYLPQEISSEEIGRMVTQAIHDTSAVGMQDMGKVMVLLKSRLAASVNMGQVSACIKEKLTR